VRDALYLNLRYLARHPVRALSFAVVLAMALYLPLMTWWLADRGGQAFSGRARCTPYLVGPPGEAVDLVLGALFFQVQPPGVVDQDLPRRMAVGGLVRPVPLHVRVALDGHPVVGTTTDYLETRDLVFEEGRPWRRAGECVLGADLAQSLGLGPGRLLQGTAVDACGTVAPPADQLVVCGVLARAHSPDDAALFTSLETAWRLEGTFCPPDGDGTFPLSAILAQPQDALSREELAAWLTAQGEKVQVVCPHLVLQDVLSSLLQVPHRRAQLVLVSVEATGTIAVLLLLLTLNVRRRELITLYRIGAGRRRLAMVVLTELVGVLGVGMVGACALLGITLVIGGWVLRVLGI
jgi:putative ABC transport system permease protein